MSPLPSAPLLSLLAPALPVAAVLPPETGGATEGAAPEMADFSQVLALSQGAASIATPAVEAPAVEAFAAKAPAIAEPATGKILPPTLPAEDLPPEPSPQVAVPRPLKVLAALLARQPRGEKIVAQTPAREPAAEEEQTRPDVQAQPQPLALPPQTVAPEAPETKPQEAPVRPPFGPTAPPVLALRPELPKPLAAKPEPVLLVPQQDMPVPLPPQAAIALQSHPQPIAQLAVTLRAPRKAAPETSPVQPAPSRPEAPVPPAPAIAAAIVQPGDNPTPISAPGPTERPADFTQIVDRLVAARDLAVSGSPAQPVHVALQHGQFGKVSLRLEADGSGLSVAMASSDPAFAPAVQSAAQVQPPTAATSDMGGGNASPHGQSARADSSGQPGAQGQPRRTDPEPRGASANPSPSRSGGDNAPRRRGLFA